MHNYILNIFLIVIVVVVFAQVFRIRRNEQPLIMGIIAGLLGALCYKHWNDSHHNESLKYYLDMNNICKKAALHDQQINHSRKSPSTPAYRLEDGIYSAFPTNFTFEQNPPYGDRAKNEYGQKVPDGWLHHVEDLKISNQKYNIDGELIHGNVEGSADRYTDDYWLEQQKPFGADTFTAADLHMSRKPREAFYYQSRWGVNSIRPWIQAELDDHANKIWWEDNPDLEQYM